MTRNQLLMLGLGATLSMGAPAAALAQAKAKTSTAATTGGAKLVEKVTRKGSELVIPYEKYVLPNGLTVIVTEDHSDPIAHVDVTYHVGSARETIGKSGFAHFFEHMMFQGSDHVADEQHFKTVSAAGGTLNGSTNRDRTNYFETLPNNQLETAMWLEADRMGFLLDAVTQKKFENQRSTVKNERGQNYDNRPYGLASEMVSKNLYPYGHPYSWMTIGYLEDLDRSDVNDLKNFFLRWYGPNNATLTVGGDVNTAEVVKLAEKYFGSIQRGPAVQNMKLPAPVLTQDRYVSYTDNVRFPMLRMVFPTVPNYHPDETPLDALAEILGGSRDSPMYQNLVKKQKAVQANAGHPTTELAGEFTIVALAYPGKGLDSLEVQVRKSIAAVPAAITDEAVARYKASVEADLVNSLSSVSGKVSQLAQYQTIGGNANRLPLELKRIQALTKADVVRVYNQYIKGKKAVVLSVVPKATPNLVARADNYTISKDGFKAPKDEYAGLKYVKPTDTFDRAQQPKAGTNPVVSVPPTWNQQLANRLKVIGTQNTEIPSTTLLLTIRGGHRLEQNMPNKAGIASLTASLMNESTEKYTAEQFAAELEKLGSSIQVTSGAENTQIFVQSLTKNLDKTLALLDQRLLHPKFEQADFDRIKKQTLEGIANQNTQPVVIADKTFARLLYGPGDIMSTPTSGTESTVSALTLDDVKKFYYDSYAPNISHLVVVSDADQKALEPKLAFLQKWEQKAVTLPASPAITKADKSRLYFVNKDAAPQSEIRIGYLGMPYDATGEYYRATLANYILGGAFNSRINLNLREDKGYTYGARSGFQGTHYPGAFTAQAGVRADATAASVKEFMKEIEEYRKNGIKDDELDFVKQSIGQSDALKYETGQQKAGFLARLVEYDLQPDYVKKQSEILQGLTKQDVAASVQKYLPAENMYLVVTGDKKYLPELKQLGYEVVELDLNGNPVTSSAPDAAAVTPAAATPVITEDTKKVKVKTKKGKDKDDSQKNGKAPYRMNAG
ncbi:insulinase family protein [Hymenobacter busanensis]|uniref:Insulinase family protein n=1 Tax=Hymenobacter busanensis TaxID=2607656 RepID=A0A7L5A0P2_9BACT|nr:pitrilysin family protein [Hymenobacter busanensis]KAA9333339.1 insulinase family protein [Hymenobacter busanensis]QHJ07982.1 insulinase family protein [Hymenobacter busanensis]